MKRIEFFNANDVELFIDFAIENELNYKESENGLEWIVENDVADKIQKEYPYYDYWKIEIID